MNQVSELENLQNKFYNYCKQGNLENAKEIYNKFKTLYENESITIPIVNTYDTPLFCYICRYTINLDLIKWISSLDDFKIEIDKEKKYIFIDINKYITTEIIKFILTLDYKPSIDDINESFINSCSENNLDIAKWLLTLDYKPSIDNICKSFINACRNNNLDISKWLVTLDDINKIDKKTDCIYKAFIEVCVVGYLDMAKWILTLDGNLNIRNNNDEAFRCAYKNNNAFIAEWLTTLCDEYYIDYEVKILKCCIDNDDININ
jgi:hypothetical protein